METRTLLISSYKLVSLLSHLKSLFENGFIGTNRIHILNYTLFSFLLFPQNYCNQDINNFHFVVTQLAFIEVIVLLQNNMTTNHNYCWEKNKFLALNAILSRKQLVTFTTYPGETGEQKEL